MRTLTRLCDFHIAEIVAGKLGVRTMLPPLSRRQARNLPDHLAERHREEVARGSHWPVAGSDHQGRLAAEFGP